MYEIVGKERLNGHALTSVVDDVRSNVPCTTLTVSIQLSKINDFVDWMCHNAGMDIHISPNIQMARYRDQGLTCWHNVYLTELCAQNICDFHCFHMLP